MTIRYGHTNIIAADWEKLAKFYQQVFDCVPVPPQRNQSGDWLSRATGVPHAHLQGIHLRLPGHGDTGPTLEIYSYTDMVEKSSPFANRKGFGHIAFQVPDVEICRSQVLQMEGADLGSISHATVAGVGKLTFIYMTDPEGNILEIQHWDL